MSVTLNDSYAYCERVTRERARNFYYGMKLTRGAKRGAMYAIYAWMRQADDLADEAGSAEAKVERLERLRRETDGALDGRGVPEGEAWPAFVDTVYRYGVSRRYLHAMIEGQLLDQRQTRYETFEALYDYCYKVASVVGLSCLQIWGYEGDRETLKLSEYRGIAFQLTNILRDVAEDLERDRVYLPVGEVTEAVVREYVGVAREYYEKSAPLDERVHEDGRACLWAMTEIYRGLLEKIAQRPSTVLAGQRVRLSKMRKGWIATRANWMNR